MLRNWREMAVKLELNSAKLMKDDDGDDDDDDDGGSNDWWFCS